MGVSMAKCRRAATRFPSRRSVGPEDQDDIGRLDRDVGTGTDRDPDIRLRQSGCVVDAVADHRHLPTLPLEFLDLVGFLLRQDLCEYLLDAELAGDPLGGLAVVASEH